VLACCTRKQTGIGLNLNSVNQLIVIMVKCGVLFEVWTGFLNTIQTRFVFQRLKTRRVLTDLLCSLCREPQPTDSSLFTPLHGRSSDVTNLLRESSAVRTCSEYCYMSRPFTKAWPSILANQCWREMCQRLLDHVCI
jgi:hypothetical protein